MNDGTNFGMQPQGAASDKERPEGTSMTDHQQDKQQPRSQQELQMGEQAPQPGERAEDEQQEQSYGSTSQGPEQQRTPMAEGSEGYEGPSSGQPGRS